jgi:hypothetical protein
MSWFQLALIILVEYVFLSIAALYAFGARIIMENRDDSAADEPLQLTMGDFISKIFKFGDTCRDLEPNGAQLTDSLLDGNALSEVLSRSPALCAVLSNVPAFFSFSRVLKTLDTLIVSANIFLFIYLSALTNTSDLYTELYRL